MGLTPTLNRVLLELKSHETKTKGGVFLPETASKDRPHEGKVLAVGPGRVDSNGKRVPMEVKVGNTVLFSEYAGTEIEVEGKKHLLIKEDELLAAGE